MLSKIWTASLWGLDSDLITVEVDVQNGLPAMRVVGLADITIKEAKERIRAAIKNTGFLFPQKRVTVNLSPAGKPKEGSHFDLPIAMGILQVDQAEELGKTAFIGELSLDGRVGHVKGALPMAIGLREHGIKQLVLPKENIDEVSILSDIALFPVGNLREAVSYKAGKPYKRKKTIKKSALFQGDFDDVVGQENVKRAITVAAAGNHGLLLVGSPGCGKTMMANRIPTIMPEMSYEEKLETTKIHSIAGLLSEKNAAVIKRPFRSPHHTISKTALIGGGQKPRPGEISLAHNGILFLDEFGEFDGKLLEFVRQPIEDGKIIINRAAGAVTFPSRMMIVAASNPCKCGYQGDESHVCSCSDSQLASYFSKFSGPLIDRLDLHIQVLPVKYEQIENPKSAITSAEMQRQVRCAAAIQQKRYKGTDIQFNSRLTPVQIKKYCILGKNEKNLIEEAYEKLSLNMRTYNKIIKISRTIADLHESDTINTYHIAEALQYRALNHLYRRA